MKRLLVFISILIIGVIVYFSYLQWVEKRSFSAWNLIPSSSACVIYTNKIENFEDVEKHRIWNLLTHLADSPLKNINTLDLLGDYINDKENFLNLLRTSKFYVSLHKTSGKTVDFLYIIHIDNSRKKEYLKRTIEEFHSKNFKLKNNNFSGFDIHEISNNNLQLSFLYYKDFLIASPTPYLVEDVIRTINQKTNEQKKVFYELNSVRNSTNNISCFVNFEEIDNIFKLFLNDKDPHSLMYGNYTLSADNPYIFASGFSKTNEWMEVNTQEPAPLEMSSIIPTNASTFLHITSSNFEEWYQKQKKYLSINEPEIKQRNDSLESTIQLVIENLMSLIDNEIGLVEISSNLGNKKNHFLILETKDIASAQEYFRKIINEVDKVLGTSIYSKSYRTDEIAFLPIQEFPSLIFGRKTQEFKECFFSSIQDYLVFSDDLNALKNLIEAVEKEETWGKSLHINRFLEKTNHSANVSLFISVSNAWEDFLKTITNDYWKNFFLKNTKNFQTFNFIAFQHTYTNKNFFTNFTISQPFNISQNVSNIQPTNQLTFSKPLISKPFLFKTHTHRDFDMLVQDREYTIFYLNFEHQVLWAAPIENKIISDVYSIDYYRNNKIQYTFSTNNKIHVIDRKGEYLPNYPKSLPDQRTIHQFNVIDYNKDKKYRFSISDKNGNVFLTDKEMNLLDGWSPKNLGRKSSLPLKHYRLGNKDVMIYIQENGVVHMMNRQSKPLPHFPINLGYELGGIYFVKPKNTIYRSSLIATTKRGEFIELLLDGTIKKREQFTKNDNSTTFELIQSKNKKGYIIVRKEKNKFDILDESGDILFSKDYITHDKMIFQYYVFNDAKNIIVFVDPHVKRLFLYDKIGNIITKKPLLSKNEISILHSSYRKSYKVLTTADNQFLHYEFKY